MSLTTTTITQGFVRIAAPNRALLSQLGPLEDLVGTWFGNLGWNLIAVPNGPNGFSLEIMPVSETITFTAIGALVPNKNGEPAPEFMEIPGLEYELRVSDSRSNQPLHLENGMWLRLNYNVDPASNSIARLASIPHGDSLLAMGTYAEVAGGPQIADISSLPDTGPGEPLGYTDVYLRPQFPNFNQVNPNQALKDAIVGQNILSTTVLNVSTQPPGGILNIPYITKFADARSLSSIFWIETVSTTSGPVLQLQYSQQTDLFFHERPDKKGLVKWPHINVNTLVKQ